MYLLILLQEQEIKHESPWLYLLGISIAIIGFLAKVAISDLKDRITKLEESREGSAAFIDLKARIKTIEEDRKYEERERVQRNERISERISAIEKNQVEDMGEIRENLARIIK